MAVTRSRQKGLIAVLVGMPVVVLAPFVSAPPLFAPAAVTPAVLLGLRFLQLCWRIMREDGVTPTTWKLYKYSLLYLALLFVAMAGDRWCRFV